MKKADEERDFDSRPLKKRPFDNLKGKHTILRQKGTRNHAEAYPFVELSEKAVRGSKNGLQTFSFGPSEALRTAFLHRKKATYTLSLGQTRIFDDLSVLFRTSEEKKTTHACLIEKKSLHLHQTNLRELKQRQKRNSFRQLFHIWELSTPYLCKWNLSVLKFKLGFILLY